MMSAKKYFVILLLILIFLFGAFFIYFKITNQGLWSAKPVQTSFESEKQTEVPLIDNLKNQVGKSPYISFVKYQTKEGVSDLGYFLVKGYVYQINSENREIILAIDPDKDLYLKTFISPKAVWTDNSVSLSKDGFAFIRENRYLTGACGDEKCSFLNAVDLR